MPYTISSAAMGSHARNIHNSLEHLRRLLVGVRQPVLISLQRTGRTATCTTKAGSLLDDRQRVVPVVGIAGIRQLGTVPENVLHMQIVLGEIEQLGGCPVFCRVGWVGMQIPLAVVLYGGNTRPLLL